jgi:hypothetical protein
VSCIRMQVLLCGLQPSRVSILPQFCDTFNQECSSEVISKGTSRVMRIVYSAAAERGPQAT